MKYETVNEAAERFGLSGARVRVLLRQGRIPGARRYSAQWLIPATAEIRPPKKKSHKWPKDKRQQYAEYQREYRARKKAQQMKESA